jgi:membrane-associated phospholipid phosphatase
MENSSTGAAEHCAKDPATAFGPLLARSLIGLLLCLVLVTFCYFVVDQPVALYIYHHGLVHYKVFRWVTYPPPILQAYVPVLLVGLMVRRVWGPFRRWELALLAASLGLVLADQFRATLAYGFGRYWPETWVGGNPSLIGSGAYGFHPFHGGIAYGSFPSGHAARMAAVAAVVWIVYPRWRWAGVAASLVVIIGLLATDYHFVGDVIAGAFVGAIVGTYTAYGCGLKGLS